MARRMKEAEKSDEKIRRTLELKPPAAARLDWLAEQLEASNETEVIRKCLQITEALVKAELNGGRLVIKSKSGQCTTVSVLMKLPELSDEPTPRVVTNNGHPVADNLPPPQQHDKDELQPA